MPDYPQIVILLGPNGVGKTTLGQMLECHFRCRFLSLERFFLDRYASYAAYRANRAAAYAAFEQHVADQVNGQTLVFEEIGLSDPAQALIGNLQRQFRVALVGVLAPEAVCQERVARRGLDSNYPKSPAFVRDTYQRFAANAGRYAFDREVQNSGGPPEDLAGEFSELLPAV